MSESMNIPAGLTCSDCVWFSRCNAIIGMKADSTVCDFYPVRFIPAPEKFAEHKREIELLHAHLESEMAVNKKHRRQGIHIPPVGSHQSDPFQAILYPPSGSDSGAASDFDCATRLDGECRCGLDKVLSEFREAWTAWSEENGGEG